MHWLNPPQFSCNFTRWFFGVFFHSPDDIFNDTLPSESRSTKYNQIKWPFCSVDHSECNSGLRWILNCLIVINSCYLKCVTLYCYLLMYKYFCKNIKTLKYLRKEICYIDDIFWKNPKIIKWLNEGGVIKIQITDLLVSWWLIFDSLNETSHGYHLLALGINNCMVQKTRFWSASAKFAIKG